MGLSRLLKSKKLFMLFLLPFIVAAISFLDYHTSFGESGLMPLQRVIRLPYLDAIANDGLMLLAVNSGMILVLAYLVFFLHEKYKFLAQTTALPSLLYVLLAVGPVQQVEVCYLLVAVVFMAFGFVRLQSAINNLKSNTSIYDFNFCMSVAVLICPKLVLMALWSICAMLFSGRSTVKDISAALLGLLTPVLFVSFYYFWIGELRLLPGLFLGNLLSGEFIVTLPLEEMVYWGILAFLLLLSFYSILVYYPISVVNQRRGLQSLVSMLLFLIATIVVIPGTYHYFMYAMALPLSFIYSQYFITSRVNLITNILFLLLLAAVGVNIFKASLLF